MAMTGFLGAVLGGRGKLPRQRSAKPPRTVDGDLPATIPQVLEPLRPKMHGRLPAGMGELLVYRTGDGESFGLYGAHGDELVRELGGAGKPGFDFNSPAVWLEQPVDIVVQMGSWSQERRDLISWLNRCWLDAERNSAEFDLVIWDNTGFHIPWELFRLPDPVTFRPPSFLGALVTVTRWLTVEASSIVQDFTRSSSLASGSIAAYVHDSMASDRDLMRDFPVRYADSLWELLASLQDEQGPALAMVYAACHGEFGDRPGECKLDDLLLESVGMEGVYAFRRLHNRPTLVFLNACASGPVGHDSSRYNDGALRGFPKLFLEAGAAGVLATAAPIDSTFAGQAAGRLLERLGPGLPVARAVRDLRREAASSLPRDIWRTGLPDSQQEAANQRLRWVLYWFMYLYYGSPRMAVSFDGDSDAPAGH